MGRRIAQEPLDLLRDVQKAGDDFLAPRLFRRRGSSARAFSMLTGFTPSTGISFDSRSTCP